MMGKNVIQILETVMREGVPSKDLARNLEETILEAFPAADDDERFEEILHILASYEPGGGAYLFNEKDLKLECGRVLMALKNKV